MPGRVNLIGEHLDYNGGPVLPMAVDKHLTLKVRRRDDAEIHVWSQFGKASFPTAVQPGEVDGWAALLAGVVWALSDSWGNGAVPGADLVIESEIPDGAGLSSSAATACIVAMALADLAGRELSPIDAAKIGRRSENDYIGVPVGIMDQMAVVHDGASLLDTVTLDVTPVEIGWTDAGLSLVVVDTNVKHSLASTEYRVRHEECTRAAEALGLEWLAQAGPDAVLKFDDTDVLKKRVRHVVTETTRVRGAVRAIAAQEWSQLGGMFTSSHASMRDDFEISSAELDLAVDTALEAGALGARMTGGGFGGSAIALAPTESLVGLRDQVVAAFAARDYTPPNLFTVRPSRGAHRVD